MTDDGYFDEEVAARYDETYDYQAAPEVIEPVLDLLEQEAHIGLGETNRVAGKERRERRMAERTPVAEQPLVDDGAGSTSWEVARERLENPEKPRTYWIATVRPDGRPHVMPIIASWIDGALYFISGDATRKARNLAGDSRCVITSSTTTIPSLDIIIEGDAAAVTDEAALRTVTDAFRSKMEWPLELRGTKVHGPNAPTAGPPPYTVFRLTPSTVFGLPGMTGMEQFDPSELPRPTRWRFKADATLRAILPTQPG